MSEIKNILQKLDGTKEYEILINIEENYQDIISKQTEWYSKSKFFCPDGCGCCCHDFEPDLLESEALYMAAWLLENQTETAEKVSQEEYPFDNGKTCPFFNKDTPYHCSIYNGRPFICRLFGASGSHGKNGQIVWKPCKFYPAKMLEERKPPLAHQQYSQTEVENLFGALPPVMSDMMEQAVLFTHNNEGTKLIREILPETIRKLKWIISLTSSNTQA